MIFIWLDLLVLLRALLPNLVTIFSIMIIASSPRRSVATLLLFVMILLSLALPSDVLPILVLLTRLYNYLFLFDISLIINI
jgi:Mn2+/Fe2+ NRAMP family transporter